jgi:sec-independent protein translocase protein TatC
VAVIPKRRRRDPTATMTVIEHLGELRTRLVISIAVVAVGAAIAWPLYRSVFNLLTHAYCTFITAHPKLAVDPQRPCTLYFTSILEPFLIKLKVTFFLGLGLALPVVLYELWAFIMPGLKPRERKFALPFVLSSLVLFALGGWFAYLTLPKALGFLIGFAGTERVAFVLSIGRYIGFVLLLILAFGLSFEFPLLLISLSVVGVLSSRKLRDWRRYNVLFVAIFAAVITPSQDWFTMTAMMVPLLVFYELAILVIRLLKR